MSFPAPEAGVVAPARWQAQGWASPPAGGGKSPGGAQCQPLPGGRLHFQHGPIDIVIGADGDAQALAAAHAAAWARFQTVLAELVAELPRLRQPVVAGRPPDRPAINPLQGVIARRMWAACAPLRSQADGFITPMAAVAGAVAQELVQHYQRAGIHLAWINNGGDIALHLAPGAQARVGLYADLSRLDAQALAGCAAGTLHPDAQFVLQADHPVRGVATSGWRGRSQSRGIADSVTVLAATAAMADAAATVIANAVNVQHPGIARRPASSLRDDSDLGDIAVTVAVPALPPAVVQAALQAGLACAQRLQASGWVQAALLVCQGHMLRLAPVQAPQDQSLLFPPVVPTATEIAALKDAAAAATTAATSAATTVAATTAATTVAATAATTAAAPAATTAATTEALTL